MSCVVTSHTNAEIEEMVIKNTYLKVSKDETVGDLVTRLDSLQGKAELAEIPNTKLAKGLYLDPSGVTKRYTLLSKPDIVIPGRATDVNKENFVRSKGEKEAAAISAKPINKIKAEVGTKLHNISDQLFLHLIGQASNLYSDKKPETSLEQLLKDSGLSQQDFNNLKAEINNIVSLANKTQKEIDPSKKAKVYTEMFLLELGNKRGAVGRTLDLLVIYSDKTASHFDYKFKSPSFEKKTKNLVTGKYEISKHDWLSQADKEDYNRQIGQSAKVLMSQYGVKGMRHNRVIPAHFELKFDNKNPTNKVTQLSIGESMNKYLTQVPIGNELTDSKLKSTSLDQLSKIKNNLEEQLSNTTLQAKRFLINDKIKKIDESIKLIQINNDISGVLSLYKSLVDKYTDAIGNTKLNLRDEKVNDELNPFYIDEKDLVMLYQELGLIQKMINSSEWYNEMAKDLSDTRKEAINNAKDEFNKRIGLMLANLEEEMVDRTLSKVEQAQLEDTVDLGMMEKWFQTFGQINHPIFIKAKSLIDKANNQTRIESQQFFEELKKITLDLQKEQGSKGYNTFNILINKQTGNLHAMYKPEFWSMIADAREDGDIEVLKKHLTLNKDAQKRFEEEREKVRVRGKEAFATWEKEHPSVESMITSKYYYVYYDINKEASKDFYSEGFKEIQKYPAALAYYNFWTENMKKFKDYLDIDAGDRVPNNLIPWIKADTVEQIFQGNFGTNEVLKNMKDILAVHEATETFGQLSGMIDLKTGDTLHQIPKWFINPLFDSEGNPNVKEKSYDLSKSMMVFASTAMNYNNMKEIEGTIMALKEVLALNTVIKSDRKGNPITNLLGDKARIINPEIDTLFNDMINYHLYGVKLKGEENKTLIELMRKSKSLTQKIELGLSPLTMIGSFTATMMSRWQEAGKGYYFTSKQVLEARKILIGAVADKNIAIFTDKSKMELARALCGFFEPHQGKQTHLKAQDLSANKLVGKWLDNVLFWGYRKGDELNENAVMLAMMQNYGLVNGKISRLKNLPEGTKSLLELSSINKEGNLVIEGITDGKDVNIDVYTVFRNMVMNVNKGIKGSMNEEDMNGVNMNLLGNMMMSFKNWMPGLAEERFAGIKYNIGTKAITIGRWRAVSSDIPSMEEAGFLRLAASTIAKVGLVLADGLTFSKLGVYKVNEQRTRILFEKFKEANSNNSEIQEMEFEDFLDYKQGQIKALARESMIILVLIGMMALMSGADFDDDDEPDWKKNLATRTAYRLINRTRRELMFFINPTEILATAGSNIVPQLGLATKSMRLLFNTFDELRDNTIGENNEQDKNNELYYSVKFIPGYKLGSSLFEPFEQDKDKEL